MSEFKLCDYQLDVTFLALDEGNFFKVLFGAFGQTAHAQFQLGLNVAEVSHNGTVWFLAYRKFEAALVLRWLKTVSSTFQDLDFDASL